jgi:hypothetical protein
MKRFSLLIILAVFVVIGCGKQEEKGQSQAVPGTPAKQVAGSRRTPDDAPPSPKDMGIARETFAYEEAAGLHPVYLKTLELPSRCEALNASGAQVRVAILKEFDEDNRILTYNIRVVP